MHATEKAVFFSCSSSSRRESLLVMLEGRLRWGKGNHVLNEIKHLSVILKNDWIPNTNTLTIEI